MLKSTKFYTIIALLLLALVMIFSQKKEQNNNVPLIAIANYGPHSSLYETIDGIKQYMLENGFEEGKNIRYEVTDVNFDTSLIIQMLSKLKASKPKVLVTISTPIAQSAKNMIKDIPVVYADVTDPESAGLVDPEQTNMTGASDKQDLGLVLSLAKQLLPDAKKLGVLYSTGEANDQALVKMLEAKANQFGLEVMSVPIEHMREAQARVRTFNKKVDFIYTGSSGGIQGALPAISAAADDMGIPLFNFNAEEVKTHQALASFGVSHSRVGANAAKIIIQILGGKDPSEIDVYYPKAEDHIPLISEKKAISLDLEIPEIVISPDGTKHKLGVAE